MVYPGYLAIGLEDPDADPPTAASEIINSNRAFTYAAASGTVGWLTECGECRGIDAVLPDGSYGTVAGDPAPWYNPRNLDSAGFLGVVGLDVEGADGSTREANVVRAIRAGGVIGPTYQGPRTMVVRALAVADGECSLAYGLRWLADQFVAQADPCGGDPLTFFECCPPGDCETDDTPVGPCWVDTYAELSSGCAADWWPATYDDLRRGPPYLRDGTGGGDWCDWPGTYWELKNWLPPWGCCEEVNVISRMRQFGNARVTAGPDVLRRPTMSSGALAEIEFTIVAGHPRAERPAHYWTDSFLEG